MQQEDAQNVSVDTTLDQSSEVHEKVISTDENIIWTREGHPSTKEEDFLWISEHTFFVGQEQIPFSDLVVGPLEHDEFGRPKVNCAKCIKAGRKTTIQSLHKNNNITFRYCVHLDSFRRHIQTLHK